MRKKILYTILAALFIILLEWAMSYVDAVPSWLVISIGIAAFLGFIYCTYATELINKREQTNIQIQSLNAPKILREMHNIRLKYIFNKANKKLKNRKTSMNMFEDFINITGLDNLPDTKPRPAIEWGEDAGSSVKAYTNIEDIILKKDKRYKYLKERLGNIYDEIPDEKVHKVIDETESSSWGFLTSMMVNSSVGNIVGEDLMTKAEKQKILDQIEKEMKKHYEKVGLAIDRYNKQKEKQ